MLKIYPLLFSVFLSCVLQAQTTKRALFIGNSYTATNNLPQLVADVANSAGDTLLFDSNAPGGYTFELHTTNASTLTLIAEGTWDYVVLQEQSQIPSFPIDQVEVECFPFAAELDSLIRDANSCTETLFFMTWGRKDGDATNCAFWPPVCTYDGMDSLLRERYMMMGADNAAEVSPVGAVWHYIRDNYPDIELYIGDGSHPSGAGSYAAACAFYAAIFRKDPQLITYNFTLPADQASDIRNAASAVVYDSLSAWYIGTYTFDPHAAFIANTAVPLTATFENTSTDAATYFWDFGDGATSTEINPTHNYAAGGMYTVSLTAITCDVEDVTTQTIEIAAGDPTGIVHAEPNIYVYPNPATAELHLRTDTPAQSILIMNMLGGNEKVVIEESAGEYLIDIRHLAAGMYILVAEQPGKFSTMPFVKE